MESRNAKFSIGQLVEHTLFNYRGVIVDVDPIFQGTEEWYEEVALTRPPKDWPCFLTDIVSSTACGKGLRRGWGSEVPKH